MMEMPDRNALRSRALILLVDVAMFGLYCARFHCTRRLCALRDLVK